MIDDISVWQVLASLLLVFVAVGVAAWFRLGVVRRIVVAAVRAAVQLIAVGYLFRFIIQSDLDMALAWLWVLGMVLLTATVAHRRAPELPGGWWLTFGATATATAVCLIVIFGLRVLELEPITVVVMSGITIGNTLPAIVLAANRILAEVREGRGQVEGLLALGFDAPKVTRFVGGRVAKTALIPQIERTNVVGLISLPGAMTGLLLAGVEPLDAVLVQLIVMYLVLGSVASATVATITIGFRNLFDDDLRLVTLDGHDQ